MGHHYVPQEYLRGFQYSVRPEWIWVYDKLSASGKLLPIAKVAQSKEFYDPDIERALAREVETPANNIFRKLRGGGNFTEADRFPLALYIGTMLRRTPHRRSQAHKLVPEVLNETVAEVRHELLSAGAAEGIPQSRIDAALNALKSFHEQSKLKTPPELEQQIRVPWPSRAVVQAIFDMTWRLLITSGPSYFLTSDNPVFIFESLGLKSAESELCFPLAPNLALHGSWQPIPEHFATVNVGQVLVKELNRRCASFATRQIYSHVESPSLS